MTHDEFDRWIDQVLEPRIPSVASWLDKRPATYRQWCKDLAGIKPDAATEGLDIVRENLPSPWDSIAFAIRQAVRLRSIQEREDATHDKRVNEDADRRDYCANTPRGKWDMADAMRRIMAGENRDEVLPVGMVDDEPRYRCLHCRDGGSCSVWTPDGTEVFMVCGCKAGDDWGEKLKRVRFDPSRMRLCSYRYDRAERDKAVEWYKQNWVESRSNYSPGLAAYGSDQP